MGLFIKKEEKSNKKIVIFFEVLFAIILFLSLIGIKWLYYNGNNNSDTIKIENQVVNDISFVDFSAKYTDTKTTITVSAINYTSSPKEINSIKIKLYAVDNSLISEINVPSSFTLEPNHEHVISSELAKISEIASVEYIVE